MPVVQLQDDTGANLGSALGAAAGYFATQKQRKADKQAATTRQADLDKQNTQKNQDYHDEVTSKIQETAGQEARTKEQDVNAQFQQAANAKANNLLSSPPAGQDPAQWAQSVWTKATTPPSSGGLGLTDSKMLGDLYTQVQTAVQKATQAKQQKFIQGEQTLSGDPNKAIGTLMKRQQIEGGQGIDPKRTQDAITATQKQITEAQAAAYKNADFGERKRHDAAVENRPRGTGGGSSRGPDGLTPYEELENRRWTQTHNPDGSPKAPSRADTSGLNNAGKESYGRDMTIWTTQGMQGDPPDPTDPKYSKRSAAPAGGGGGNTPPAPKPVMHNGKAYYLHSDGNYYLTP